MIKRVILNIQDRNISREGKNFKDHVMDTTYGPDDGPLSKKQLLALPEDAAKRLPKGKLLPKESLVECEYFLDKLVSGIAP